jgi:hypothetical protein
MSLVDNFMTMPHVCNATTAEDLSLDNSDEEDGKHGESEEISRPENVANPLTLEDTLYGYTPDEGYDPNLIEEFVEANVRENEIESLSSSTHSKEVSATFDLAYIRCWLTSAMSSSLPPSFTSR